MPTSSGAPYMGPAKISYLFIDGGYLREEVIEQVSRDFCSGAALPVSFKSVSAGFRKCFYYDCAAPRRRNEPDEDYRRRCDMQQEEFRRLRMIDGWHVFEGVLAGSGSEARQKQVDIQIAVDMLTHSYRKNMHEID